MHITVLGASRFGVAAIKQLIADGHDVVLIDKDRERLDRLADDLDCGMILGNGTLPSTLRDAYGDGSDALLALTNEDDVNILASVVGRSIGYERVIPQIVRPQLLSVIDELKLDDAITPHESVARAIVSAVVEHSEVEANLTLQNELRLVSHEIASQHAGRRLGDIDFPDDTRAIAHIRDEHEQLADPDIELREGDRLMLVVPTGKREAVCDLFADGSGSDTSAEPSDA